MPLASFINSISVTFSDVFDWMYFSGSWACDFVRGIISWTIRDPNNSKKSGFIKVVLPEKRLICPHSGHRVAFMTGILEITAKTESIFPSLAFSFIRYWICSFSLTRIARFSILSHSSHRSFFFRYVIRSISIRITSFSFMYFFTDDIFPAKKP